MKPYEEIKDSLMTLCEMKVSYLPKISDHPIIDNANKAYELKWLMFPDDEICWKESFWVIYLNRALKVIGIVKISDGGTAATVVDVKIVMQHALLCNASSMVLCHNHPSGSLRPSSEDDALTKKIMDAARVMDMRVDDHIIFTDQQFYSYSDHSRV